MAKKQTRITRVLIVGPSHDILGGQAVQAARLLNRLKDEPSLEVGFLPINPRLPGPLRNLQRLKYVRTIVTSIAYVLSLLTRVHRYDVLHVFSASYFSFVLAPTPAILIGKLYGKRVLLNYHSGEAEDHLRRWHRTAIPTIRLADLVIVPSKYLVRVFADFGLTARAIFNLIDTSKFVFRPRDTIRPLFLSNRNFETHYGVDRVLRAMEIIQKKFPEARLTLAGDGSQRRSLEALANDLRLENTSFVGQIDPEKIVELYDQADIYLNGSEIDNQPLSILEAFACGLPIVTTDAGGIPYIVHDGDTGFVVPRGDYRQLAARAISLLEDPQLARRFATRGHEECRKYSWEALRALWLEAYEELMDLPGVAREIHNDSESTSAERGNQIMRKLRKLRKTSLDELRVRSSQAVAAFAERHSLTGQTRLASNDQFLSLLDRSHFDGTALAFLDHFRSRKTPQFFASFGDPHATLRELRRRWPEVEEKMVAQADKILSGCFDLLGFKDLNFNDSSGSIDWHLEPVARKRAPLDHWSRLNYLDSEIAGDKKIIWELNRHQYFATLGQAYWFTNNERYAEAFVRHLDSWMDRNPPKQGINWASSLEIALRSISWLWAFYFFQHSESLSRETFLRACKFLYLNGRHLETYLSTYFSPNTHLTGEALGLFYLGTFLPELKESQRWRMKGLEILRAQLSLHVQPDGVYFEQSSYYHRYTTDFYIHLLVLLAANRQSSLPDLEEKLKLLLDHLMYITRPDGTTPLFGDDDGGRLVKLDQRAPNNFRAALSTGAVMFERGDYKFVAGELAEESLWLLGPEAVSKWAQLQSQEPARQSVAFETGGYYVMRDGWTPSANYLLFDCGPHGTANCGHAHADALSFELAANGHTLLVDPGTHTYTGSTELRDWFRSSKAHNTLTVDDESSSVPSGPFSWKTIARSGRSAWISQDSFDYLAAWHDGYERLGESTIHARSILFLKNNYWVMRDQVSSRRMHHLKLWFHFDSKVAPLHGKEDEILVVTENGDTTRLQLATFAEGGGWSKEQGWVSTCYGVKDEAPVFTFSLAVNEPNELVTFMIPQTTGAEARPSVRRIEAVEGRAFEINVGGKHDVLLLRGGFAETCERVETARMASDFELAWARFASARARTPEELVLIGGQTLELGGREMLKSGKRIDYLSISNLGDEVRLETEQEVFNIRPSTGDLESLLARFNQ